MYFIVLPLLLLFASTICAAPVHIDSDGISENAKAFIKELEIAKRPSKGAYFHFHYKGARRIAEWCDPGEEVVGTTDRRRFEPIIIKRVDLSTVEPGPGLTVPDELHLRQLLQVFIEIKNLEIARLLRQYYWMVEKGKPYVYIQMQRPGFPSSQRRLTEDQKRIARQGGIERLAVYHRLALDSEHDRDKYFGFDIFTRPFMLRYAKRLPGQTTINPDYNSRWIN